MNDKIAQDTNLVASYKSRLNLLCEISDAVSSDKYLDDILELIVQLTAKLMNSKICSLMLLDMKEGELVIRATQSLSAQYRKKPPIKVGKSVSGRVVQLKKPITVRDVTLDPDYQYPDIARAENLKSMVSVPLKIRDKIIGVLNCYTSSIYEFSRDEIRILTSVANQTAVAIENKELMYAKNKAVEALEARKKVEKAKGILMRRFDCREEEAYRMMQRQSMNKRLSLKQIAEAIILSNDVQG